MGLLSSSKDKLVQKTAPSLLNKSFLTPYGRVTDLKLNSQSKALEVTLELKGEREPVRIEVHNYELLKENGRCFVILKDVSTSREWLTALARNLAVGKRLEVPSEVAGMVARFL